MPHFSPLADGRRSASRRTNFSTAGSSGDFFFVSIPKLSKVYTVVDKKYKLNRVLPVNKQKIYINKHFQLIFMFYFVSN
jgi:hypothetical protein